MSCCMTRPISSPTKLALNSRSPIVSPSACDKAWLIPTPKLFFRTGQPAIGNTAEAFAGSRDWSTIAPGQRLPVDSLAFSPDVRRRIVQELDQGYVVVA